MKRSRDRGEIAIGVAFSGAIVAFGVNALVSLLGLATTSASSIDVSQVVTGVASSAGVGALAYIARQFAKGNIVSRNSAAVEARLFDLTETSHEHTELLYDAFKKAGYPAARPAPRPRARRVTGDD